MSTENTTTIPASVAIAAPNAQALSRGATAALALVTDFEISDAATFEIAADELKGIKAKASQLEEQRKAITGPLDAAKKAVMDLFRGPLEVLGQAEGALKSKMLTYQQAEQRKAEEARLQAERIAREQREKLEAEARELAAQGRTGEAAVKETVAQMVVAAPVAAPAPPAVKGISTSTTVDFEVNDLHALVKHVAAHPELINLITADSVKIRAYVRGLGMATNLPGVSVFQKQTMAARKG
jgi:hypothetical protein